MLSRRARCGILLLFLASAGIVVPATGQISGDLRSFMRRKLDLSKGVLEGLTLEDYALVAKNARELKALSTDAQWRMPPNPDYLRLTSEFQAYTDDMVREAEARDLDGATLAYVQMTLSCVACHDLVRAQKAISLKR
jgi:hypothetical protein